ncbi:MAG: branched-chain amino acid ABC transporter permease [Solirubrobacterales bacterium]
MSELALTPLVGQVFDAFSSSGIWFGIGVIAGTFTIFALGLQLNVGFTGIDNFGQAGFMAVGAYTMAILVTGGPEETGPMVSFWLALPIAIAVTCLFGLLVGLSAVRLRSDYLAIATIAAAEAVRLFALNAQTITGGPQGLIGFDDSWDEVSDSIESGLEWLGWSNPDSLVPLFLVVWGVALILTFIMWRIQKTPWGRVLRAVREDEDAARALGKNAFSYKLQSLVIAGAFGAIAGFFLALNTRTVLPDEFLPILTFLGYVVLVLGGLANYWGIGLGAILFSILYYGLRFIDVPLSGVQLSALSYILVGLTLILLMAFRPQGMFGKKEEMVLGD